jgi:DNA-binding transcriptional LysR family regulator
LRKRNDARVPPSADNIATFVEVVRRQSLSAAARSVGLPKSTISRRLLRLEQTLHSKLLHRDARKITLTPAGRRFYESVVAAVDALDAAVVALEQSSSEPRGAIRVTAPADLGRMVLAPMFVAFLERHPDISLELVFTNRVVDLVQEGIDLAVRAGRSVDGSLIARKLCDSELQLAASATVDGAPPSSEGLRGLEQRAFVLYGAPGRAQVLKLERGSGARRKLVELTVTGRIYVDDYAALAELVASGGGLGLLPAIHVREGVRTGRLRRVLPEWTSRTSHVYLVYPTRQQPERVRLLTEFLVEAFAKHARV